MDDNIRTLVRVSAALKLIKSSFCRLNETNSRWCVKINECCSSDLKI